MLMAPVSISAVLMSVPEEVLSKWVNEVIKG